MKNVAIIIDAWETKYSWFPLSAYHKCYRNIRRFVEDRDDISHVLLSSYDCDPTELNGDSHWYNNSKKLFGDGFLDLKKEFYYEKSKETEVQRVHKLQHTDRRMLDWKCDKQQLALHYQFELDALLDWKQVKRIYLMGQSWEDCVRLRPLGYVSLQKFFRENDLDIEICISVHTLLDRNGNQPYLDSIARYNHFKLVN